MLAAIEQTRIGLLEIHMVTSATTYLDTVCRFRPRGSQVMYLDPATGSILLQMIAGGVAGAAMLIKLYWRRVRAIFGFGSKDDEPAT